MRRLLLAFLGLSMMVSPMVFSTAEANDTLSPLVKESYDELMIVHELATDQRNWEVHRVYFVRKGRVIADRILTEDMNWSTNSNGEFQLFWNDYGSCHRLVTTKLVSEQTVEHDSDYDTRGEAVPWWGMGRRMTDLEAPQEE